VIHDWNEERAIALLTRCHQAMPPWGKVLLVERVILTGSTPQVLVLESDVQMQVMAGGKERTDAEYRGLRTHPAHSGADPLLRDRGSTRVMS
jgi:orsellinic acid C2-O-methyltransferase